MRIAWDFSHSKTRQERLTSGLNIELVKHGKSNLPLCEVRAKLTMVLMTSRGRVGTDRFSSVTE